MDIAATVAWVTFGQPWWLLGLVASAGPVALALAGRRRGRRIPTPAVVAQCLAVALAVAALAQPAAPIGPAAGEPFLLLIDASDSLRGQWPERAIALPAGAASERYYFAESLSRQRPIAGTDRTLAAPVLQMIAARARDRSLSAAVIASDGRFADDWAAMAEGVARGGAKLLIVPANAPPRDGRIVSVQARRGVGGRADRVELTVVVESNAPMKRRVEVTADDGATLDAQPVDLLPDIPAVRRAVVTIAPDAGGVLTARLAGEDPAQDQPDAFPENDRAAVLVLPEVGTIAAAGDAALLGPFLARAALPTKPMALRGLPDSPAHLAAFAAVVLLDPTGAALSSPQRKALAEYARAGGGIVMIGVGPHAAPSDREDPLNLALPLAPDPFQRRPLHLTVLLDRSASMGLPADALPGRAGQVKFDIASEAVLSLKDHLTARDALTVIAFANDAAPVYDSGPAAPDFVALTERLRKVRPVGTATRVTPALAEALQRPPTAGRTPMILVLSDLETESFDPAAWAEKIKQAKARLAVVTVGRRPEPGAPAPPLEELVKQTPEATYTQRADLAGLAEVFAGLVRRGRGEVVRRGPTPLKLVGPLFDTGLESLPDAEAVLLTAPRGERVDLLIASAGDEPIVARRTAGLGRTVSIALPIATDLNVAWSRTPQAAQLLAGAVKWAARPGADARFDGALGRGNGDVTATITARADGQSMDGLSLTARLAAGERLSEAALLQTAPGRYEGNLPHPPDGADRQLLPVAVDVVEADGAVRWRGQLPAEAPAEYREIGADAGALSRLAGLTGGHVVRAEDLPDLLAQVRRQRLTPLWPWLLGAALAVMLVEWCTTRVTRH